MPKNLIIIPSYNEKKTLIKILKKNKAKYNILIMDDKSTDGTTDIYIDKKKVSMISNKKNYGYERNLLKGFKTAIDLNYDFVITFDADGEHDFDDLDKIKKFIKTYDPDLLIGDRKKKNRFAETIIGFFFQLFYNINDPLKRIKVYKVSKLKNIFREIDDNYYLVDIIKLFIKKKCTIYNIKINTNIVKNRISRIDNNFQASLKILKCIKFIM